MPISRKALVEWSLLAAFSGVLLTDLRPVVLSTMQRGLLATGLWRARPPRRPAQPASPLAYPHAVALYTLAGQPTNLQRYQGKAVLVNVWASWCPPCRAELPGLQALYQQVDTAKVALVLISLDEQPRRARAFLARSGYTLPVFFPAAPLPVPFASPTIPVTVVLAPDGQVAGRYEGMADYDTPEFRHALEQLAEAD